MDEKTTYFYQIWQNTLKRDPTKQELSRYQSVGTMMLRDIARSIYLQEVESTEEGIVKRLALNCKKELGVSLVSTYNCQCGIATYCENLFNGIKQEGFRCNVISDSKRNRNFYNTEDGVDKSWNVNSADYSKKILKSASLFENKIIHIQHEFGLFHDNDLFLHLIHDLRNSGFKVVVTLHTVLREKNLDIFYKCADVIIVHSEFAAHRLYGNSVNNITAIHHGTEKPLLKDITRQDAREFVKQFIDLSPGDILATSPGFISKNKMILESAKAVNMAVKEIPNLKYLVIGSTARRDCDIPYFDKLKQEENSNIKIVERFLNQEEMAKVLIASDFAVMNYEPTHYSVSGMSHLLMTYRVPSVSSTSLILCSLPESTSLKVDCFDVGKISDAVKRLCREPGLRESMMTNLDSLAEYTDWSNIAKKHISVYRSIF